MTGTFCFPLLDISWHGWQPWSSFHSLHRGIESLEFRYPSPPHQCCRGPMAGSMAARPIFSCTSERVAWLVASMLASLVISGPGPLVSSRVQGGRGRGRGLRAPHSASRYSHLIFDISGSVEMKTHHSPTNTFMISKER